ncbi:hypothetical protein I4U23_000918 [Adineta vaga]|nr:hypothetical protein I4U23_000918 [Adineta vaga]
MSYHLTQVCMSVENTHEQHTPFITLKEALMAAPFLLLPNFTLPFIVVTDASMLAGGGE